MSVVSRALGGAAWTASSGWLQAVISLISFGFIAVHLSPLEIGAFGVAAMVVGFADMAIGSPLAESLQQRRTIDRAHVNATFWISLFLSVLAALAIASAAPSLATAFDAPIAADLLTWSVWILPMSAVLSVCHALLARELQFGQIAGASAISTVATGLTSITLLTFGVGVWSLVIADFVGRTTKVVGFWWCCRYRPGPPTRLGAIRDLARFNIDTISTYLLGYADRMAPQFLTGLILGAAPLGYLIVAQRVLSMITQLVLTPLSSVTMASVARVQDDPRALRVLILSLYRVAALVGFPAFLGAALIVPDVASLLGDKWLEAVLAAQILLLVGLRTTTGMFNIAILRGLGQSRMPLVLLATGLLLNLSLVPALSAYGVTGVAVAVLLRTYLSWPIGLWLIRRASGLAIVAQVRAGVLALGAAILMAGIVAGVLVLVPDESAGARIAISVSTGLLVYGGVVTAVARRELPLAAQLLQRGEGRQALRHIAARFGLGAG